MQRYNNKLQRFNSQENKETREEAAKNLLKVGAPIDMVRSIVGDDLQMDELDNPNQVINANLSQSVIVNQSPEEMNKQTNEYFDKLMNELNNMEVDDFTDPINLSIMKDPVIVSSGHVFDRSSVYTDNKMNFSTCPISRQELKADVYPVIFLKRQINEWLITRFDHVMQIAKLYINQQDKFGKLCDQIETIIEYLGEDIYTRQSMVYAEMLLSCPYETSPQNTKKILFRIYNHIRHDEQKSKEFQYQQLQPIMNKFYISLNQQNMEQAWLWHNICEEFEDKYEELKPFIQTNCMKLEIAKQGSDKETISQLQQKIYYEFLDQGDEKKAIQFLEEQDLNGYDMEDHRPVVTEVGYKSMSEMTDQFLKVQELNKIKFSRVNSIVINANWKDQGWGNKKGALGLELVRGSDTRIAFKDIFGTYDRRNDNSQKRCTLGQQEDIVNKFRSGDKYILLGRVGGGGGHRLEITSVEIKITSTGASIDRNNQS